MPRRRPHVSRRTALVGLVVFAVVDVILVGAVLAQGRSATREAADATTDLPTPAVASASPVPPSATPSATASATPSPAASPRADTPDPASAVLLDVGVDGTVVRAERGTCRVEGKVEAGASYGKKLSDVTPPELRQVLAVQARSDGALFVVGTDRTCSPLLFESVDAGRSWTSGPASDAWYLDPDELTVVHGPAAEAEPGCTAIGLDVVDPRIARVGCTDGRVLGSGDGGRTWTRLGSLDDLRAVTFPAPGNAFALRAYAGCAATTFASRNGSRTWSEAACIDGAKARAIGSNGSALVAQVDTTLYVSFDYGLSWERP